MRLIARVILLPLLLVMAISLTKPSYAYWSNNVLPTSFNTSLSLLIGSWVLPLNVDYDYEVGEQFTYNDLIWTVVETGVSAGPNETRMMVIIPGQGLVLIAITDTGSGKTVVIHLN